ncbi:Rhamnogalacturonan acetylesterase rhgT [Diplodia seriata]|uniref:Rhamnogalacturonan acetylesterase rhgT n=1 Tax=Diplodia seriata TaxID=420778 RepID=A0A1S8B855_9PEZI|nr:Rhamnogalacturonan acetylesterase rhgT [Diplodia seriata]
MLPSAALLLLSASAPALARSVVIVPKADKPGAFFLAGDSTTAVQSENGGGWGSGFLETTLQNGATGTNYGHNGATTVSFREGGDWDTVLQAVKDAVDEYTPYVTIQFGHNDQKSEKGISIDDYKANLEQFVEDVRDAGGKPILVTPLSRRQYSSSNSSITENLAAQRAATLAAADATAALSIDLNRASTDYLNAIGEDDAATYNLDADDKTHLNAAGSVVFGNMVSWLMWGIDGEGLSGWTVPGEKYVEAFEGGVFVAE